MKTPFITLTTFVFILIGCIDSQENHDAIYRLVNQTRHDVKIYFYQNRHINGVKSYTLNDSLELFPNEFSREFQASSHYGRPVYPDNALPISDSASMIIDNKRFTFHINHTDYIGLNMDPNKYGRFFYEEDPEHYFTYYITEDEYENAIPLDSLN